MPAKNVIEQLRIRAAQSQKTIVFPEAHDPRVVDAAQKLHESGFAKPLLISGTEVPRGDVAVVSTANEELVHRCASQLFENRRHKGLSFEAAKMAIMQEPLLFASTLVAIGEADGAVAGSIATTASVIRAGLYGIGTLPGTKLVSSFFLMQFADRCLTYADCGVVPDPNAQQLAEIAVAAANNHQLLTGETPRVAMLSFSTKGSAEHPRVEKVRQAISIANELSPEMLIDGEFQFDAAYVESVASRKAPNSNVAGKANVFIFPDLDSGNIAYKISERLGGAIALGPLVQGLQKPFMDLSRGCSAEDIVDVAVVASVIASN